MKGRFMKYSPKIKEVWNKYHIKGHQNFMRQKIDAIFISNANTIEHEWAKHLICYKIRQASHHFITEAAKNMKKGDDERIIDVVDLNSGLEYEIETDPQRAKRFIGDEIVIKTFEDGWEDRIEIL